MALWTRPNVEDNDDDEFFGEDGESDDDYWCPDDRLVGNEQGQKCSTLGPIHPRKGLAEHEVAAVEAHYQTLGYHETYESSQEATLQEGFVAGYTENFDTAFQIGAWLGRAAAVHRIHHDAAQHKEHFPDKASENDDDDDVFRKAVARIKIVLSETATQESASGIVVPAKFEEGDNDHDHDDDDTFEISAKIRTDPLIDLQLELEALVLPHRLPKR